MISGLRRLISMDGLRRPRSAAGQVSTFLLLGMVAVLIFIMAMANFGKLSVDTATTANAADAATLSLGSQLASRSNQLCKALGDPIMQRGVEVDRTCVTQKCKQTGLLGTLITIAVVTIGVLVTGGASLIFAIALGAGTGASMGAITGTGALSGALHGAMIGAGIGLGISGVSLGLMTGSTATLVAGVAGIGGTAAAGVMGNSITPGTIVGDRAISDAFAMTARSLSGVPDYEQLREGTFFQALTMVAGDPNFTKSSANPAKGGCYWPTLDASAIGDPFDSDGDGNLTESVPCLQHWIAKRIDALQRMLDGLDLESIVRRFIRDDLKPFRDSLTYIKGGLNKDPFLPQIERLGIEYGLPGSQFTCPGLEPPCLTPSCGPTDCPPCEEPGPAFDERPDDGPDGPSAQFWRAMERRGGQDLPFWLPGPDQNSLLSWYDAPCDPNTGTCPTPPSGFDSVDSVRYRLEQFLDQVAYYLIFDPLTHTKYGVGTEADWIRIIADQIRAQTKDWFKPYYVDDPADPAYEASWYNQLDKFVNGASPLVGMREWIDQSETLVNRLQGCKLAWDEFAPYVSCSYVKPPICENNQPPFPPYDELKPPLYSFTWKVPEPPLRVWMHYPKLDDFMGANPKDRDLFPGPVCKIDSPRRTVLLNEVRHLRDDVVMRLWSHIVQAHLLPASPFPAQVHCHGAHGSSVCSSTFVSSPWSLELVSIDEVQVLKKRGKNLPPFPDDLEYRFTYKWLCRECNWDTSVDPPECSTTDCSLVERRAQSPWYSWCVTHNQLPGCLGAPNTHIMRTACGGSSPSRPCDAVLNILQTFDTELNKQTAGTRRPFATIDGDVDDEFRFMYEAVEREAGQVMTFRSAIKRFYDAVMDAIDNNPARILPAEHGQLPYQYRTASGGLGPLWDGRYTWRDSQGDHTAEVEIGPFKIASIQNKKYGNWLLGKTCLELTDYCDNATRRLTVNGSRGKEDCRYTSPFRVSFAPVGDLQARGRTWVRVRQTEPTNKDVGWWTWNPFSGRIEKRACSMYGPEDVELSATRKVALQAAWGGGARFDVTPERCR